MQVNSESKKKKEKNEADEMEEKKKERQKKYGQGWIVTSGDVGASSFSILVFFLSSSYSRTSTLFILYMKIPNQIPTRPFVWRFF